MRPLATLLMLLASPVLAQGSGGAQVYAGGGILPGTGVFAAYSAPRLTVFTQEAALYADYTPRIVGGSGRLLSAVGIGGGLRIARIATLTGVLDDSPLDLDAGLRLGPSFYTAFFETTAEEEARSFRVMFDPFARLSLALGSRAVFAEIGNQAPSLRGGLSFGL